MISAAIAAPSNWQGALAAIKSRCRHQKGAEGAASNLPAYCNGEVSEAQASLERERKAESVATKAAWASASTGESFQFTGFNFRHVSLTLLAASVLPLCR